MPDGTDLWQVPLTNRLRWQCWGDEFIVYNAASGHTHYLNNFAKEILQYFEVEPATISGLIADIQTSAAPPTLCDQIRDLVKEFDSLGLIARVSK